MIESKPLPPCIHCGALSTEPHVAVIGWKTAEPDEMFVITGKGMVCGKCYEKFNRKAG